MEQLHHYQMPSVSTDEQLETVARSTRGASKYRRDQINLEIQKLRDLLPLNSCVKDRLFQLQVMSLSCIYIRKQSYLPHIIQTCEKPIYPLSYSIATPKEFDTYKALRGFLLMLTSDGKILHISENASEYLGYSVEEIMCQGDIVYDLVDARDHLLLQQQLANGPPSVFDDSFPRECSFVCRMNLSKTVKRQLNCYKFIMIEARYIHPIEYYKTLSVMANDQLISPIFAAFCTPLICPKNSESLVRGSVQIFQCLHEMNLHFTEPDFVSFEYLGYSIEELISLSLYDLIHPDQLQTLVEMHQILCREKDGSVMGLIRLKTANNTWIWLHSVLTVKSMDNDQLQINGIYQHFSDEQAESLLNSPWIYSTKHYSNYKGDLQKDSDLMASSPESTTRSNEQSTHLPTMETIDTICSHIAFDPNNNFDDNNNQSDKSTNVLSSLHSPSDSNAILFEATKSICLEQLQQLCASEYFGTTLPDLSRQDLEEFFRQVEQSSSNTSNTSNTNDIKTEPISEYSKGIKREYDDHNANEIIDWTSTNSWSQYAPTLNTQLPPVSTLGSFLSNDKFNSTFNEQSSKRHKSSSTQYASKQQTPYTTNSWTAEHCYHQSLSQQSQREHGCHFIS